MSKLIFVRGNEGTLERDGIKGELLLIDDEDEWIVRESQWRLLNGLAITRSNKKTAKGNPKAVFLHELIVSMSKPISEGKVVKFENGNKKDLRKKNLILCDKTVSKSKAIEDAITKIESEFNQLSEEEKEKLILGEKGEKNV